jgi:hypothetical protein
VPRLPLGAEVSNISVEDISANSNNERKSLTDVDDLVSWDVLPSVLYRSISLNSLSQMRPSVNRNEIRLPTLYCFPLDMSFRAVLPSVSA